MNAGQHQLNTILFRVGAQPAVPWWVTADFVLLGSNTVPFLMQGELCAHGADYAAVWHAQAVAPQLLFQAVSQSVGKLLQQLSNK